MNERSVLFQICGVGQHSTADVFEAYQVSTRGADTPQISQATDFSRLGSGADRTALTFQWTPENNTTFKSATGGNAAGSERASGDEPPGGDQPPARKSANHIPSKFMDVGNGPHTAEVDAILRGFSIGPEAPQNTGPLYRASATALDSAQYPVSTDTAHASVIGWANDHGNDPAALNELTNKLPQLRSEGVQTIGMEFLDKNGEQIAQKYLDSRTDTNRQRLLEYLKGQYNSSGADGQTADNLVKVIEAAGDNGMKVKGLEPNVDHLLSPEGGFRTLHNGLMNMTENERPILQAYLNGDKSVKPQLESKLAGMDQQSRDNFFHLLDQMQQSKSPIQLLKPEGDPGHITLPPSQQDSEESPDPAWSALKQELRNSTWAQRISETVNNPDHPSKMIVYAGPGHFERQDPQDHHIDRVGQHVQSASEGILPDALKALGIDAYITYPSMAERDQHH